MNFISQSTYIVVEKMLEFPKPRELIWKNSQFFGKVQRSGTLFLFPSFKKKKTACQRVLSKIITELAKPYAVALFVSVLLHTRRPQLQAWWILEVTLQNIEMSNIINFIYKVKR